MKCQSNSSCVIMSVLLMTTVFYKALILQGEIWCCSLLGLKGLKNNVSMKVQLEDFSWSVADIFDKGLSKWVDNESLPTRIVKCLSFSFNIYFFISWHCDASVQIIKINYFSSTNHFLIAKVSLMTDCCDTFIPGSVVKTQTRCPEGPGTSCVLSSQASTEYASHEQWYSWTCVPFGTSYHWTNRGFTRDWQASRHKRKGITGYRNEIVKHPV